jgi:hypothetical protein
MKFGRPLLIEVAATFIESGLPDFVGSLKIQAKIIVKYCKIRPRAWAVGDNRPYQAGTVGKYGVGKGVMKIF